MLHIAPTSALSEDGQKRDIIKGGFAKDLWRKNIQ